MPELLLVCTGNVCRSPLAEVLLRRRFADLDVRVHSAGTHALAGAPMTPESVRLALLNGADPAVTDAHRARQLTEALLETPDLILGLTRAHRRQIVELAPHRVRAAFTLREFARLSAGIDDASFRSEVGVHDPSERLTQGVAAVARMRGHVPRPVAPDDDDVVDPYRQSWNTYLRSADQLVPAVDRVAEVIRATLAR